MRYELLSELRTIYETSDEYPHTLRVTMTMKDMVDGDVLKQAVGLTMKRYPYFCVRLVLEDGKLFFAQNDAEIVVCNSYHVTTLGGEESNYHLLSFRWWKNKIHIDAHHSFADGAAMGAMFKTLLYYYCSAYYEKILSTQDVRLSESPVDQREWEDPYRLPVSGEPWFQVRRWTGPAFQLAETPGIHLTERSMTYNVRIPEREFLRFNLSNEGSPGTVIALFLARAIENVNPTPHDPVTIAMCLNQRKALGTPYAHNSLVGCVDLVFKPSMRQMDFAGQVTCFRGAVALQSDREQVLEEVREYQSFISDVERLPSVAARRAACRAAMLERSRRYTATVSYVGKSDFGEAERYIQQFDVLPSAALPSIETPVNLEVSAVHGQFFVNFIQRFQEDCFFNAFIRQLRENDIDYDVMYCEEARYPQIQLFPAPER